MTSIPARATSLAGSYMNFGNASANFRSSMPAFFRNSVRTGPGFSNATVTPVPAS